jgi:predicted nucleic acid-binding protein
MGRMKYLLDACAFITFLDKEDGALKVDHILALADNGEAEVYMTSVQLLEVYYDRGRAKGWDYAEEVFKELTHSSVRILYTLSPETLKRAGRLKVAHHISLADSIACAAAQDIAASLVTSDHDELESVDTHEPVSFYWLTFLACGVLRRIRKSNTKDFVIPAKPKKR